MYRLVLSGPKRRVESEELGEEFGLGDKNGAIRIVKDVEAQEASCVPVQSNLVVFPYIGDN